MKNTSNPSKSDLEKSDSKESHAVDMIIASWWADLKMQNLLKAMKKDEPMNPSHNYSHREGSEEHPKFFYTDAKGNYVRYTNAPDGHSENSKYSGEPGLHPNEPIQDTNPEYFTEDGRKLSRAPMQGAQVEWNPSYHPSDNKNLWVGRWVNPTSGEHEYTYLDKDIRNNEFLRINRQNALVDVRLPQLRRLIWNMFKSPQIKDQVIALMLSLLDQGRCRLMELCSLTPQHVQLRGDLVLLGSKIIHADPRVATAIQLLASNPDPTAPLFAIPMVKEDGQYDMLKMRRVGRHMITRILESVGITLDALHSYHATQTYSQEMQRILYQNPGISMEEAHRAAVAEVAEEMGYDLSIEPNPEQAMALIQSILIDPVAAKAVTQHAGQMNLGGGPGTGGMMNQIPQPAVPYVTSELSDKTFAEKEFGNFLHTSAIHSYL